MKYVYQWWIQGRGPGGPPPPYFWRLEGPEKKFLRPPPPYLRVWMTAPTESK